MAYTPWYDAACWKSIVVEYSNVFEPPRMHDDRDTMHHIELEPGSVPKATYGGVHISNS